MISEAALRFQHNDGGEAVDRHGELADQLMGSSYAEDLFDRLPHVVFFVKDVNGRYVAANQTLVERCAVRTKSDLVGRTARELFPAPLGERYLEQDLRVCATGEAVEHLLELHLYPDGSEGWCLTDKVPVLGSAGTVVGVAGMSRDLHSPSETDTGFEELAAAVNHIRNHYDEPLRVDRLAAMAQTSVYQFNRRIRAIFQITAGQLITKTRIDAASRLLRTTSNSISDVAASCGYSDQSAFTRQFKATVGLTPGQYRERHSTSG